MTTFEEIKKFLPDDFVPSPHVFMICGAIGEVFHEEIIIGDDVYRSDVNSGLDPDGYRYSLTRVMSFDHYFCHSRSKENQTAYEVMNEIYGNYDQAVIWVNPDHPAYHRKTKYKSIY